MAFSLPNFNLVCKIWTGIGIRVPQDSTAFAAAPRLTDVPCAVVYPAVPMTTTLKDAPFAGLVVPVTVILFPKSTDIRGLRNVSGFSDGIEAPSGSGHYYSVIDWETRGLGYANEHRAAMVVPMYTFWPTPTP